MCVQAPVDVSLGSPMVMPTNPTDTATHGEGQHQVNCACCLHTTVVAACKWVLGRWLLVKEITLSRTQARLRAIARAAELTYSFSTVADNGGIAAIAPMPTMPVCTLLPCPLLFQV